MKLSKAEKERRKEKRVLDYFDGALWQLTQCYEKNLPYSDFTAAFTRIVAFQDGCCLADSSKWKKKFNARFDQWLIETEPIRRAYGEKQKKQKEFYSFLKNQYLN